MSENDIICLVAIIIMALFILIYPIAIIIGSKVHEDSKKYIKTQKENNND